MQTSSSLIAEPAKPLLLAERPGSDVMLHKSAEVKKNALGVDLNGITGTRVMNTDTDEEIWVNGDLDGEWVDITFNPHPFPVAYSVVSAISVPTIAPAALGYAKQEAHAGLGLYIAFNADNDAEYVVLRTDMAHMLDGFRVR